MFRLEFKNKEIIINISSSLLEDDMVSFLNKVSKILSYLKIDSINITTDN